MKKLIVVAFLSAAFAAPVFAADAAKTPAAPAGHKHAHPKADMKDECDSKHKMDDHYGHGMMGGHGAGMMGGHDSDMMMEPDMHMLGALALGDEQQAKINKLADQLKHDNWASQGLLNDETAKLRDLYQADKRDPAAIGKEYQKVFDLKRQMIVTYLETENSIEAVLTPEQLAQMKDARNKMRRMYGHPMH